ncbi:MAG: alpha/beta fold hydrolase [Actinomycetota bacterium]|nr:alpha/beta fold hydrolase [Actinomycetota bacterium]
MSPARRSLPAQALLSPRGLRGAAREAAWVGAHLTMYPLGLLGGRRGNHDPGYAVSALPPVQRGLVVGDVEAAGTPILLLHGMVDNGSVFTVLRRGLTRRGFGQVVPVNYSPLTMDVRVAARRLAETVEELVANTGYRRVHVVGHSLGGLVARYYVQRLGGDARVHTLVTLGTPHTGTIPAYFLPLRLGRQLRPGSDLMTELAGPAPGCRTRFLSYWSDLDQMIIPKSAAQLHHPDLMTRNVRVHGVGHLSFAIDRRVVHEIGVELAQLDAEGRTLGAGVTVLGDRSG